MQDKGRLIRRKEESGAETIKKAASRLDIKGRLKGFGMHQSREGQGSGRSSSPQKKKNAIYPPSPLLDTSRKGWGRRGGVSNNSRALRRPVTRSRNDHTVKGLHKLLQREPSTKARGLPFLRQFLKLKQKRRETCPTEGISIRGRNQVGRGRSLREDGTWAVPDSTSKCEGH